MFTIIFTNAGFAINLLIPLGIALYMLITNKEYILKEFGIQMGATITFVLIAYFSIFYLTTDLIDVEQHNGHIVSAAYYEGYEYEYDCSYESCSGSGKDEVCVTIPQTCEDWKSPEWYSYTSNSEEVRISKNNFKRYRNEFKAKEIQLKHYDQTYSSKIKGEGDKWVSYPNKIIPSAVSHKYQNYVTAAEYNVVNVKTTPEEIKFYKKNGSLREYPTKYEDKYGTPKLYRVVNTVASFNDETSGLLDGMDLLAARLGRTKQVNPILYIVNSDEIDSSFKYVLESYWKNAKKNDVILILGINSKGVIEWSDSIAWSKTPDLIIDLQNFRIGMSAHNKMELISDLQKYINTSYVRKPMADYEYLTQNISIDFKYQALIFLINLIGSFFLFRFMLTNSERKWR